MTPNIETSAYKGLCGPKILLVEDQPEVVETTKLVLSGEGYEVTTASNSSTACNLLEADRYSLVLLDWNLGFDSESKDVTGSAVVKKCRSLRYYLPVVVISGDATFDARNDGLNSGADAFLAKPVNYDLLVKYVSRWMEIQARIHHLFVSPQGQVLSLEEMKRQYVLFIIDLVGGNLSLAAKKLGIHRHTVASIANEAGPQASADNDK